MSSISLALRALTFRASAPAKTASDQISAECLSLLKAVDTKGGWVEEDDPVFDQRNAAMLEGLERGLLTMGGGWSVGCRLTRRGRKTLAAMGSG